MALNMALSPEVFTAHSATSAPSLARFAWARWRTQRSEARKLIAVESLHCIVFFLARVVCTVRSSSIVFTVAKSLPNMTIYAKLLTLIGPFRNACECVRMYARVGHKQRTLYAGFRGGCLVVVVAVVASATQRMSSRV